MKLYVGNLPFSFTEQQLADLFQPFGSIISVKLIINNETGRSKGFGFVEMGSKEEAANAIDELNEKEIGGRPLIVNEARQPERKSQNRSFSNNKRSSFRR